ncbi:hypothetical protein L462_01272 [Enterobacter sp. BIDMC 26]|nr:hypothetical protein L462_01272 [Enterobacter sp. BIDMC 26]
MRIKIYVQKSIHKLMTIRKNVYLYGSDCNHEQCISNEERVFAESVDFYLPQIQEDKNCNRYNKIAKSGPHRWV